MTQMLKLTALAVAATTITACSAANSGPQTADLGAVLDRTEMSMVSYTEYMNESGATEATEENMDEFQDFLVYTYNTEPFYDKPLGVDVRDDATILGFADDNMNQTKDAGEADVFTVEIDGENQRLIASDMTGNSSSLRVSGTGIFAGYLLGRFMSRQRGAGVNRAALAGKTATPRSSYRAPATAKSSARSRARTGGSRVGK